MNEIPGLNLIPEKYRALVMLLVLWGPLFTRAIYRISQGGGLRSILAAFWLGTNTPAKTETGLTGSTGLGMGQKNPVNSLFIMPSAVFFTYLAMTMRHLN